MLSISRKINTLCWAKYSVCSQSRRITSTKFTWWSWRTLSSFKTQTISSTFSIWKAAQLIGQSLVLLKRAQLLKT
jgi:hypothetical protein